MLNPVFPGATGYPRVHSVKSGVQSTRHGGMREITQGVEGAGPLLAPLIGAKVLKSRRNRKQIAAAFCLCVLVGRQLAGIGRRDGAERSCFKAQSPFSMIITPELVVRRPLRRDQDRLGFARGLQMRCRLSFP